MKHPLYLILFSFLILSCSNRQKNKTESEASLIENDTIEIINFDGAKFDFEPDIRLFTIMALSNAPGYDLEDSTLFAERKELHKHLDAVLSAELKEKIKGFKNDYGITTFSLTNPPDFDYLPDSLGVSVPCSPAKDPALLSLLNEFYIAADIPALWAKYQARLREYNYAFAPFTGGIQDILNYCRVDGDFFDQKQFVLQICPFMQKSSAYTCSSASKIYIVASPAREAGPEIFYHEPLHHIVNPVVEKYTNDLMQIKNAAYIGSDVRLKLGGHYLNIEALAPECLVRTIDYILRGKYYNWDESKTKAEIYSQYSTYGLSLIPFFYEELKAYEASDLSLEDYFPRMLRRYDLKKEQERWKSITD